MQARMNKTMAISLMKMTGASLGSVLLLFVSCGSDANKTGPAARKLQAAGQEAAKIELAVDKAHDDVAAFIAGQATDDPVLQPFQATEEWKKFAQTMDLNWAALVQERLHPMREWADRELGEANSAKNVLFYPFGGPDLLTAFHLFPTADVYILLGLEWCGKLPQFEDKTSEHVRAYLEDVQLSLSDFFQKSYFITRNMMDSLQDNKVDGVLPLICFFLKRTGQTISSIKRLELDEKGDILETAYEVHPKKIKRPYGVRVDFFAAGSQALKTVYFFSVDLSDERMGPESKFYAHLSRMGPVTTFIKSASYLLHYSNFSNIRNIILAKSRFILQDDTGIPFRYFHPESWDVALYGKYGKPVQDFKGVEQPDLKAAYEDRSRVKPLAFTVGYHWGSHLDSLLLIKRIPR